MKHLKESDLESLGFTKHLMPGTGWLTTNSMRDALYYYENGRIAINATEFWTWFLDGKQRNDIAVSTVDRLEMLLREVNND